MQIEVLLKNYPVSVRVETNDEYAPKTAIVVSSSNNGLELGVIKGKTNDKKLEKYEFVRVATSKDKLDNCEACNYSRKLLPEIKNIANDLKLDMKIGFISTNLDKSKLTINYTADERVDFREMLKVLTSKYKSRIEMHQIGNRDESKVLGAIGMCGRICCCKLYLSDFDKVSIKMAKNQNISLNPTRINGMCGRLLCCLKYEDDYYSEMNKKMPKIGSDVTTPDGIGKVKSTDVLRETVQVEFLGEDTTEIKSYPLTDITIHKKEK